MAEARRELRLRPAAHGRSARGARAGTDAARADAPAGSWPRGRVAFSRLTLRILAVNVLALAILVGGLMYLPEYRRGLIAARTAALAGEARIIAGALGESAVTGGTDAVAELDADAARILLRRIAETTSSRARLFGAEGNLVADSSMLSGPGGIVRIEELPPPQSGGIIGNAIIDIFDGMAELLTREDVFERYRELAVQHATDYPEVTEALNGSEGGAVRLEEDELFMVSAALPVQRYKSVVGALLISSADGRIEQQLRELRLDILKLFGVVMAITVLMSLYLARSIVAPLVRLSRAADQVRRAPGRQGEIPDFTGRHDEIGDLSGSVRGMTDELWRRIDAIEQFAADVAHEIKNPLSSLQSAVETAARIDDPERRERLMAIIVDDVQRLNRLITDISHASRLDSQIVRERETWEPVDLEPLLHTLVAVHEDTSDSRAPMRSRHLRFDTPGTGILLVEGNGDRFVQVFRNLLGNAMSFAPAGSVISVAARREDGVIEVTVDDEGPGIPEENLDTIFNRFYTARPSEEKFGTHSGLGLSISRQIIEAHGGTLRATNRYADDGSRAGARFVIRLPALPAP